jgi:hypothetical protein
MKILYFFLFCRLFLPSWIQIRIHILNANPGPATQINADPAPQPWITPQKILFLMSSLAQATNQDLDVEVQFVEDITDILNVPDETLFILDQDATAAAANNPPDLGSENPPDLTAENPLMINADAGAAEDIHTIEQFLGQPLEIAAVSQERGVEEEPLMMVTRLEDDQLVIVDDQPSEDIDEIQRFLEGSQPFDDYHRAGSQMDQRQAPAGKKDKINTVPESSSCSDVKYKIPKTPEFKKRFQNKEIVKIVKGTDSHHHSKHGEKIRGGGGAAAKAKPAPPSFEDQLHEAELIDIRRISSALGEKKRKWKNKSSTRDYMITKKYAKIVAVDSTPARRADSPVEEAEGRAENR